MTTTEQTTDLTTEVATVLSALSGAAMQLPLDENLNTPREVERNYVARTSFQAHASRLRVDMAELQRLDPRHAVMTDWITTLTRCKHAFKQQLAASEGAERTDMRSYRQTEALRQAVRILTDGPELAGRNEVLPDLLVDWFREHHIEPLPGETGFFSGRGGLRSAERRLEELTHEQAEARAQLERTLEAAKKLLG